MNFSTILEFLSQSLGIDPETVGLKNVTQLISQEMSCFGMTHQERYLDLLKESQDAFHSLVDKILVPETWFFRGSEPFYLLRRVIEKEWLNANRPDPLRILSAACSSGEEPYSIAMILLETGLSRGSFHIDAIDISRDGLAKAASGEYGKGSFREKWSSFQRYFFTKKGEKFQIHDILSQSVQFHSGNLSKPGFLAKPYHIVFCRNLIIYFHPEARKTLINSLGHLLLPKGYLFVGHAELPIFLKSGYVPMNHPRSFACQKIADFQEEKEISIPLKGKDFVHPSLSALQPFSNLKQDTPSKNVPSMELCGYLPSVAGTPSKNVPFVTGTLHRGGIIQEPDSGQKNASQPSDDSRLSRKGNSVHRGNNQKFEQARKLADQGFLQEALGLCEQLIESKRYSIEVFTLMGLIFQTMNQFDKAEQFFQRAVYLDPHCSEALIHLSLLYERKGDFSQSEIFKRRSKRATRAQGTGNFLLRMKDEG